MTNKTHSELTLTIAETYALITSPQLTVGEITLDGLAGEVRHGLTVLELLPQIKSCLMAPPTGYQTQVCAGLVFHGFCSAGVDASCVSEASPAGY